MPGETGTSPQQQNEGHKDWGSACHQQWVSARWPLRDGASCQLTGPEQPALCICPCTHRQAAAPKLQPVISQMSG